MIHGIAERASSRANTRARRAPARAATSLVAVLLLAALGGASPLASANDCPEEPCVILPAPVVKTEQGKNGFGVGEKNVVVPIVVGTPEVQEQTIAVPTWPVPTETPTLTVPGQPEKKVGPVNGFTLGPYTTPAVHHEMGTPGLHAETPTFPSLGGYVEIVNGTFIIVVVEKLEGGPSIPGTTQTLNPPDVPSTNETIGIDDGAAIFLFQDLSIVIEDNRITIPLGSLSNDIGLTGLVHTITTDGVETEPVALETPAVSPGAETSGLVVRLVVEGRTFADFVSEKVPTYKLDVEPGTYPFDLPPQATPTIVVPTVPETVVPGTPEIHVPAQALPGAPEPVKTPYVAPNVLLERTIERKFGPYCVDIPWVQITVWPSGYSGPQVGPVGDKKEVEDVTGNGPAC